MRLQTTKARTQPGQFDAFVRQWREHVAPHALEMSGLRGVFLCGDRDTNTVVTIHLWENPPDQAAHAIHDRVRFRDRVRDIIDGDPAAEVYEVLAAEERR